MTTRIYRRDFLKLAGLAGAGIALASCKSKLTETPLAQATEVPTAVPTAKKFKKNLLMIPTWWGPHEIAAAESSFNTTFKDMTGIEVKYEFIGSDFNAKVFTNLVSDNPYDAITFDAGSMPAYLDKGILMPINDLIARDNYDTSNIITNALGEWTYGEDIYGLTADMGSFHTYFNLDLFDKAGLTPPKPDEDWTWDQLLEYAKKLTIRNGDQVTQYGLSELAAGWMWELWPNMNGVFVFDEGVKTCLLDDPKAIEAFDFWQKLVYDEGVAIKPGAISVEPVDLFLAGQLAILIDGTWSVGYLRSNKAEMKYKWDVGMLPKSPNTDQFYFPTWTSGWVLPKNVQDIDASWEAMKYYASDTFAKDVMFAALSGLPCTKSALEGAWYDQWPNNPPEGLTKAFYSKWLEHGAARRSTKYDLGPDINAAMNKIELITSGEKKAVDVLPEIAQEVNQYLKERPWNQS